jgi:hypothetical protein
MLSRRRRELTRSLNKWDSSRKKTRKNQLLVKTNRLHFPRTLPRRVHKRRETNNSSQNNNNRNKEHKTNKIKLKLKNKLQFHKRKELINPHNLKPLKNNRNHKRAAKVERVVNNDTLEIR